MKRFSTCYLILFLISAFIFACSDYYDHEEELPTTRASGDQEGIINDVDLSLMYFDEESGMWLLPEDDPIEMSGGSDGISMTTMSGGFTPYDPLPSGPEIPITAVVAKYLKIWPKTQEQIDTLRSIEKVIISYHPFDAMPVPTATLESLGLANVGISSHMVRYYDSEEEYCDHYGNILAARQVPMPVLYAEWPLFTPYPEWMDYEIIGEKEVYSMASAYGWQQRYWRRGKQQWKCSEIL